ncbi:MAG: class I SAM-dependent methyltransferase, partial [Wenzhouxiangellaceae bacterium]|nr:class I SAM-dependent methyltransferase [Wenzhouxiangellaceae bacterium]
MQAEQHPTLEFTGERFTPECVREIFYEHWHRYAWAGAYVAGLDVLDCACGEGYGSRLLADSARSVVGVDLDETSIAHARQRYAHDKLEFRRADALALPFEDRQFDCVVSFETLEHLAAHDDLLAGFKRVLKPGGFVLLSSPDRKTYSDETGYDNPYHVRELYRDEFE